MKQDTFEIVLPVWTHRSGFGYFGCEDFTHYSDETGSAFVSLRAVREGDKYPYFNDEVRAINNIGFYVWFDSSGTISIDLRLDSYGRQTIREAESSLKMFKRITAKVAKKYPMLGNFHRSTTDIHTELTLVLDALGVKRSVKYQGIGTEDAYWPVALAIKPISDILEKRRATLRPRQAA